MNWFLYLVTEPFIDGDIITKPGEKGVGQCSMSPGIMEAPYGVMYVIPESYVVEYHKLKKQKKICASLITEAVEKYFGISLRT